MTPKTLRLVSIAALALPLALHGCGGDDSPPPSPTPTPSPMPSPTPSPTPSPAPSPAPSPTPAPAPTPAPSPTPAPAPTPAPSPTPAPAPTPAPSPTPAASYTVGGNVSGLRSGASVVLTNNGGGDLTVTSNGSFSFATPVTGAYGVAVKTQPAGQTCTVANGSGTATAAVGNVTVTCTDAADSAPSACVPTRVGSSWTHRIDGNDLTTTITAFDGTTKVIKMPTPQGTVEFTTLQKGCNLDAEQQKIVTGSGATMKSINTPPLNALPSQWTPGFSETVSAKSTEDISGRATFRCEGNVTSAFQVIGPEAVTVIAGAFPNAVKFTHNTSSQSQCVLLSNIAGQSGDVGYRKTIDEIETSWFVPGVGVVKTIDSKGKVTQELVSYSFK